MNTTFKRIALVAGLFATGTLLAYGTGPGGSGFFTHHGWNGHMTGMTHPIGAFMNGDIATRLDDMKTELGITPAQEDAWHNFAGSLVAHSTTALAVHESRGAGFRGTRLQSHDQFRQDMWQQRQAVGEAAAKLIDVLNDDQRLKAGSPIGYGLHHAT